jgi:hypothetical protein
MRQVLLDRANDSGIARIGEETKRRRGLIEGCLARTGLTLQP